MFSLDQWGRIFLCYKERKLSQEALGHSLAEQNQGSVSKDVPRTETPGNALLHESLGTGQ